MKYQKIDIHCHTTDRVLKNTTTADASLNAINSLMLKHDITHTLLLATYFPHRKSGISNFRLRSWIDGLESFHHHAGKEIDLGELRKFLMFGSLDFENYFYQGYNELEELASRKRIQGIKIYAGYQQILPEKLLEVVKLASTYKIPVMFHTGDCTHMNKVCAEVVDYDSMVEQFPDVDFIYTHLCNPHHDQVIERVKRYSNVYTDISGLIHSGRDDHEIPECILAVRKFYDSCGIDRLMFGTDFPVQTHEHTILIAEQALHGHATNKELEKFYRGTAAKLLKLQP